MRLLFEIRKLSIELNKKFVRNELECNFFLQIIRWLTVYLLWNAIYWREKWKSVFMWRDAIHLSLWYFSLNFNWNAFKWIEWIEVACSDNKYLYQIFNFNIWSEYVEIRKRLQKQYRWIFSTFPSDFNHFQYSMNKRKMIFHVEWIKLSLIKHDF